MDSRSCQTSTASPAEPGHQVRLDQCRRECWYAVPSRDCGFIHRFGALLNPHLHFSSGITPLRGRCLH